MADVAEQVMTAPVVLEKCVLAGGSSRKTGPMKWGDTFSALITPGRRRRLMANQRRPAGRK